MTVSAFLMAHLAALSRRYRVTVVVNANRLDFLVPLGSRVKGVSIGIVRQVAPVRDTWCLLRLALHFRWRRVVAVHSVTPKAGLLSMAAAFLARVPVRIHTFTGQVWVTRTGLSRRLLRGADRLIAALATHVLVDSPSQMAFLVSEGVVPQTKARVLARGSISGVDASRFRPDPSARSLVRRELGLSESAVVFLFVGRLTFDKGLTDLARAFGALCEEHQDAALVLVGPDEEGLWAAVRAVCFKHVEQLRHVDYTTSPERYMAAADVFCLPSYREGFGSVIIEAASAGIPAIGSRIPGIVDAIQDGVTGLLHEPKDPKNLLEKMQCMVRDESRRHLMGAKARERALVDFSQSSVTEALLGFYSVAVG
jgi:glycosyltransferase involved in cell wall biosynthesis